MNFSPVIAGFLGLGAPELIIILVILLVLFGGAKLPSLAKNLGQSIKEFKKSAKEESEEEKEPKKDKAESPKPDSSAGKN